MLYFMQNVPYFARFYLFLCVFSSFTFLFLRGKTQALYSLSGEFPPQNAIVNGFRGQKRGEEKIFFGCLRRGCSATHSVGKSEKGSKRKTNPV
jgi:hypothetical protein